ncbi:hypothetical protein TNCV_1144681 [Trichonephila clavipes]|nr:hypothetical protein TNCV_1144681 [Trichonephila clavipes]
MVLNSLLVGHEFEPSATKDQPRREGRCTLNMSRLRRTLFGVMWKLGDGVPAQVSSSFDHGKKLRGSSPIVLDSSCFRV